MSRATVIEAPRPSTTAPSNDRPRTSRCIGRRGSWASLPLLALVGFLVLVPAGFVLLAAFSHDVPRPGSIGLDLTLDNFRVLAEAGVLGATRNSLVIAFSATLLALLIGGFLAFITARTDVPCKRFIFLIGLMPIFLPSYVGALAWSLLGSPGAGLLNVGFRDLGAGSPINVYSVPGVVVVMAMYYSPYAFLLIHSAMSLMNPDLEDASSVHGGSTWRTIRSITTPLALPAISGAGLLIFILVLENFPVAQVLATPGRIDTLPTFIYRLMNSTPTRGNEASVVAIVLVAAVVAITLVQRRILARRSYTSVSGKGFKPRTVSLGRLKVVVVAAALSFFILSIVLPLLALLLSAVRSSPYMRSFGSLTEAGALDATSFADVLGSSTFTTAATNSVVVSVLAALGGTILAFDEQARELLESSVVDTSNGLRIDGDLVADKHLYEAAKNDTVLLYSGTGKEAEDLTAARFLQETGIEIKLTRLPTNKLAERVLSEHGAGQLRAEVIRVTDPQIAKELASRGVFAPYRTPFHDLLIQQRTGVRDTYLNCYYFVNAMGYNSAMIEENPPTRWQDLADPRYRDKLGIVAITTGGTNKALANFQIENFGADFLRAQGQQNPRIFDSTSTEVDALARGEIEIASVSFNNAFAAELAGAPIKLVIPEVGVSGSEGLMGMTAKGVKSPAAQVFMNWTMSKAGQRFAAAQGFVPARTDIGLVRSGDYQLPPANSPRFHLYTEEEYDRYAARDEELWKSALNYVG